MKTIVNKTRRPIRVRLHGGKVLHLGPSKTGQISDEASQEATVRRLVDAGEISILSESPQSVAETGNPGIVPESPHGHPPPTVVLPKGNR